MSDAGSLDASTANQGTGTSECPKEKKVEPPALMSSVKTDSVKPFDPTGSSQEEVKGLSDGQNYSNTLVFSETKVEPHIN